METLKIKKFIDDFKNQVKKINDGGNLAKRKKSNKSTFKTNLDKFFESQKGNEKTLARNRSMPELKDLMTNSESTKVSNSNI